MMMLDIFTHHGQTVNVPNVRYIPIEQALDKLEDAGLQWEIDSIWSEDFRPGVVIEQTPNPGSSVKHTRVIMLTVNMMFPPKVELPKELNDMAASNGITLLKSLGFKTWLPTRFPARCVA